MKIFPSAAPALVREQGKRRASRYQPLVEALDRRQLLAAGISGQVSGLYAVAGESVAFDSIDFVGEAPSVTAPLPLVIISSTAGPLSPSGFTAPMVSYGDGSPATAGAVLVKPETNGNLLLLSGPDHIYATPGTYTITVSVIEPGDTTPTVFLNSVVVHAPLISISSQVDNSVTVYGLTTSFVATAARNPIFTGTTQAGASVVLTATNLAHPGVPTVIGSTVAAASGYWAIASTPLIDGQYTVTATATGAFGATATGSGINSDSNSFLVVDAGGPKITGLKITNGRTGTFTITYNDPYGLNPYTLTQPSSYVVTRLSPAPRKGQTFAVANLTTSYVPVSPINPGAYTPVTVTGVLTTGKTPLSRNGTYLVTIPSANITSVAGSTLDGEYTGKFPTGDGQSGGDFRARIVIRNGKAVQFIPLAPAKTTSHVVKARAVTRHHG